MDALSHEVVLEALCNAFGVDWAYLSRRKQGGMIRPVAAQMLCKYAGMNQRAVDGVPNIKSGGAPLRKWFNVSAMDETLKRAVEKSQKSWTMRVRNDAESLFLILRTPNARRAGARRSQGFSHFFTPLFFYPQLYHATHPILYLISNKRHS